jgi:hypothetical protein
MTDSTLIRLHDLLKAKWPACRTNHTQAALKAHLGHGSALLGVEDGCN